MTRPLFELLDQIYAIRAEMKKLQEKRLFFEGQVFAILKDHMPSQYTNTFGSKKWDITPYKLRSRNHPSYDWDQVGLSRVMSKDIRIQQCFFIEHKAHWKKIAALPKELIAQVKSTLILKARKPYLFITKEGDHGHNQDDDSSKSEHLLWMLDEQQNIGEIK